jgi:hypothetical protein
MADCVQPAQRPEDVRRCSIWLVVVNVLAVVCAFVMWFVPADMSGSFVWGMPPAGLLTRTVLFLLQCGLAQAAWSVGKRLSLAGQRRAWLVVARTVPAVLAVVTIGVICSRAWGI